MSVKNESQKTKKSADVKSDWSMLQKSMPSIWYT